MRRRNGIILVTVLFFTLLVGVLARAILIAGPGFSKMGTQSQEDLLAQRAAEFGAVYARAQLRTNVDWKGALNTTTVSQPDLKVVEDSGNIIGWMKNAAGQVSMFRIRFNCQDGATGYDMVGDPDPKHFIDHVYVSVNNLRSNSPADLPRANPVTFQVSVPPTLKAPSRVAVVEVEGLSGAALSGTHGPDDPRGAGPLVRRVLRVHYAPNIAINPSFPDSVISAGYGLDFETTQPTKVSVIGTDTARLRTKKGVNVKKADGSDNQLDMSGEIGRDPGDGVAGTLLGSIVQKDESVGDGKDFHSIKWSDVPVASADPAQAVQIKGGVYTAQADGTYLYYDMKVADYKAAANATTGVVPGGLTLSSDFKEVRPAGNAAIGGLQADTSKMTLIISKDVNVVASDTGVNDIVITPTQGRRLQKNDPDQKYRFASTDAFYVPGSINITNAVISTQGNAAFLLNVQGKNANLTAEGSAVVAAPSVKLEKDLLGNPDVQAFSQGLSIYAKGELTISTFISQPAIFAPPYVNIPAYEGYGPLELQGLIYSWGNSTIYSGTPGVAAGPGQYGLPSNYGNVTLKGALVAYGGDPASGDPGANGEGRVRIYGELADITYDPSKLAADASSSIPPSGPLPNVLRLSYGFEKE